MHLNLGLAQNGDLDDAVAAQARREIADCDAKLRQHRAALEAGSDPQIVTGWMAETQAQRAIARIEAEPRTAATTANPRGDHPAPSRDR
jgi:site-specific DNA recombinase